MTTPQHASPRFKRVKVPTRAEQDELLRRVAPLMTALREAREANAAAKAEGRTEDAKDEAARINDLERECKPITDELVTRNMPYLLKIAKKYARGRFTFEDAVQEAYFAMRRSIEKFDIERGYALMTYATWWLRAELQRAMNEYVRLIHIPVHELEKANAAVRNMRLEDRSEPTPEEEVHLRSVADVHTVSLQKKADPEGTSILEDVIPDPAPSAHHLLEAVQDAERINKALKTLNSREADIVRMRFGLAGTPEHTLDEVGEKFSLTRERIRQIEGVALRKLRMTMATRDGYIRSRRND